MGIERRRRKGRHRVKEAAKSVLLLVLAVMAVYLAARAQFYSELDAARPGGWLGALLDMMPEREGTPGQAIDGDSVPLMAAQAVRVAVHSGDNRFGTQYDTAQTDRTFDEVAGLLSEGLASARVPRQVAERQWRDALKMPGIYFDFLGAIPMDALYTWLGAGGSNPNLNASARRIVLAYDGSSSVLLYYNNEDTGMYYACETSVAYSEHLDQITMAFSGNGATFAFELSEEIYDGLDPYVLILPQPPASKLYRTGNPLEDDQRVTEVERTLAFRPQAGAEYPVPGGTMIREGKETLQISNAGTIHYNASEPEASRYQAGEPGDSVGQIETARKLAAGTLGIWCGSARLYLMDYSRQADGSEVLRFGYSLNGAIVQLGDEGYSAKFIFQDGRLIDYILHFRSYEEAGEGAALLPERQAAAALAAMETAGGTLMLCYEDSGGDSVQAGWVAG